MGPKKPRRRKLVQDSAFLLEGPALLVEWAERGIDAERLEVDTRDRIATVVGPGPDTSLDPTLVEPGSVCGVQDLPNLPRFEGEEAGFVWRHTLGTGGMGEVRAAFQEALHREVAVKRLLPSRRTLENRVGLVREARVLAALDHPNVVPVYALLEEEDQSPVIVMKRLEGRLWSAFLGEGAAAPPHGAEPLDWNLSVLERVAEAVQYAHDRGVLHRDLKPDNVLIGEHGEVWLLDWGLAVRLHEEVPLDLPLASSVSMVAGTPGYMAPEMAAGAGPSMGPHTDVYLLGACLHAVVTGETLHQGEYLQEILEAAFESYPVSYSDRVPDELAQLLWSATHRQASHRPQSARAFQDALEAFRSHRHAASLTQEALRRATVLRRTLYATSQPERSESLEAAFVECQFAFDLALDSWPENPKARKGRAALREDLAYYDLAAGNLRRARAELEALRASGNAASQLWDRLRKAESMARQEADELEAFRTASTRPAPDLSRERGLLAVVLALAIFATGELHRSGVEDVWTVGGLLAVLLARSVWLGRGGAQHLQSSGIAQEEKSLGRFGSFFVVAAVVAVWWEALTVPDMVIWMLPIGMMRQAIGSHKDDALATGTMAAFGLAWVFALVRPALAFEAAGVAYLGVGLMYLVVVPLMAPPDLPAGSGAEDG